MSPPRAITFALVSLLFLTLASLVLGASPKEQAEAKKKFELAFSLMDNKEYGRACPLFEQSQALDPGMGTLFRLAECYEHTKRLASAQKHYQEVAKAAELAGMKKRQQVAADRAAALAPRTPKLQLVLPEAVAAIAGLEITVDDVLVERSEWKTPIPVDGGEHRVRVAAPKKPAWSKSVSVDEEGETVPVEVPSDLAVQAASGTTQTVAGLVVAGVGVAAMGAGVLVGVLARSDYLSVDNRCSGNVCDVEGVDTRRNAMVQGDLATAIFSVGAAALVAGTVTWLTSPSGDESSETEESTKASLDWRLSATADGAFGTVGVSW